MQSLLDLPYLSSAAEAQKLDLYLPVGGDGPHPLVVWIHGGSWQSGSKDGIPARVREFAVRGYAVASVGYRLSHQARYPAQIEDCKAAVRWLRSQAPQYGIDPERIGAWGASAGGGTLQRCLALRAAFLISMSANIWTSQAPFSV